ncbi:hypothetical protein AVEN_263144-1 [Araneus ventricosus]|uniref:Uncharacterized protein n=1 Tax=Araneus ventricosus TaxID=182803 RepID=A0A4Y2F7K3_ARAVE|nr:hypothetical protein AVEN_263144-1 [Araneus ventricosus]
MGTLDTEALPMPRAISIQLPNQLMVWSTSTIRTYLPMFCAITATELVEWTWDHSWIQNTLPASCAALSSYEPGCDEWTTSWIQNALHPARTCCHLSRLPNR